MKNITLFLTVLFTVLAGVKAREADKVFPTSDAMWSVYFVTYGPTEHYIYGLTGDTIINKKEYSKLYLLNDTTLVIDERDIYVGGIRQQDKKVYLQPATNNWGKTLQEFVLYDFSKTTGEYVTIGRLTAEPYDYHPTFENAEKMGVGEAFITDDTETGYGRKLTIQSGEEWIENIGGLSGFFFHPLDFSLDGKVWWFGGILGCMKENGEIKYLDKYYCDTCFGGLSYDPNLSVRNETLKDNKVFYSKSTKTIGIENPSGSFVFELFSLEGTPVMHTQDKHTISTLNIQPGIYLYRLSSNRQTNAGKLIINH